MPYADKSCQLARSGVNFVSNFFGIGSVLTSTWQFANHTTLDNGLKVVESGILLGLKSTTWQVKVVWGILDITGVSNEINEQLAIGIRPFFKAENYQKMHWRR